MGKGKKNWNIPMCAALLLLCLTMISTYMTCGLYARYTVTATGSDSARVARFAVEETGNLLTENATVSVTQLQSDSRYVTVNNKSEVAVSYTISVVNVTNNLNLRFRVQVGEDSEEEEAVIKPVPFVGYLQPGESAKYTLIVSSPNGTPADSGKVDLLEITLLTAQID